MPSRRNGRSNLIAEPSQPALTFRGEKPNPHQIMQLWKEGKRALPASRKRITEALDFRRKSSSSLVRVDAQWARANPEAAAVARLTLPHRVTLERDLIAKVGAVDPEYTCEPLGFRDTDQEQAEAKEAYLEEWRLRHVNSKAFAGKGVEDGEFGLVHLPSDLDMDGAPDFFEYLEEASVKDLPEQERRTYERDDDDRRKRYVKRDATGTRVISTRYRPADLSDEERARPVEDREQVREKRAKEAEQKHQDDVTDYILRKGLAASAVRIIPALDCVPILRRGRGRDRWELTALVERTLYEPNELLEMDYGWSNLGDRVLTPRGYTPDGEQISGRDQGSSGQLYLYTAYFMAQAQDGEKHPCIAYTVAGAGTWYGDTGSENDPSSVGLIDLYQEYDICTPLWGYFFGLHTEDDDPDYYGQPYMSSLIDLVKGLETQQAALRSTIVLTAFTGHIQPIDPKWGEVDGEPFLETSGDLRRAKVPAPGQIEPTLGPILPFQQAQIGADAWRLQDLDRATLAEATAIDQIQGGTGPSGHALLVANSLGQVAKRQNRECVKDAVVFCGESLLVILDGIHRKYGIKWPVRTTQERPVKGSPREGKAPAIFDPEWVKDGQWNLDAHYPEEANMALVDLEASLADRGYSSFENVQEKKGASDSRTEWVKVIKDKMRKHPAYLERIMLGVAQQTGDRDMVAILKGLQQQGEMTQAGIPGAKNGIPTAALQGPGEGSGPPSPGPGGPSTAASVRGGVEGASQQGAALAANAQAALVNGTP